MAYVCGWLCNLRTVVWFLYYNIFKIFVFLHLPKTLSHVKHGFTWACLVYYTATVCDIAFSFVTVQILQTSQGQWAVWAELFMLVIFLRTFEKVKLKICFTRFLLICLSNSFITFSFIGQGNDSWRLYFNVSLIQIPYAPVLFRRHWNYTKLFLFNNYPLDSCCTLVLFLMKENVGVLQWTVLLPCSIILLYVFLGLITKGSHQIVIFTPQSKFRINNWEPPQRFLLFHWNSF